MPYLQKIKEHLEKDVIEPLRLLEATQNLTNLEIKVLRELAYKGPLSGYDFHLGGHKWRSNREAICSSRSWLIVRKRLLDKKLIRSISLRKTRSNDNRGRRKDLYCLTLRGLILLSYFRLIPLGDVVKAAGKNKLDSLIFKKWDEILQFIPEDCAFTILANVVEELGYTTIAVSELELLKDYKRLLNHSDESIESSFSETFLRLLADRSICVSLKLEERTALLKSDPTFRKLFMQIAVEQTEYLKSELDWYQKLLSKMA
jgi:hypothetical protein